MDSHSGSDHTSHELAKRIRRACLYEVTARKPGNVHPQMSFDDLCYENFVLAASLSAPVLAEECVFGIGTSILRCVEKCQLHGLGNVNLGILLLLAPLVACCRKEGRISPAGLEAILCRLSIADAEAVYSAIQMLQPGGMGAVSDQDVSSRPTVPLRDAMRLASDRDLIARQYANGYQEVLGDGRRIFAKWCQRCSHGEPAIIGTYLELMSRFPDSLIARKCGIEIATESAHRAQQVLLAGWPESRNGRQAIDELDLWLRTDGHRRNPGTTADLISALLFCDLEKLPPFPECNQPNGDSK